MTYRHRFARALAAAFLAGDWCVAGLRERGSETLGGEAPAWLATLARGARARFRTAPDRAEDLARFLRTRPAFADAFLAGERPRVRRRFAAPSPRMGPSPWPVPALPTTTELAAWLEVSPAHLDWYAGLPGPDRGPAAERLRHYRYAWTPKRTGGLRLLEAPKTRLKGIQRRILDGILSNVPPHEAAHGFRAGRSVLTFARPHTARAVVLRLDLTDFFGSVAVGRVFGIFRSAGYPVAVARVLAALCTHATPADVRAAGRRPDGPGDVGDAFRRDQRLATPHLPQGSPTSPALSNLAAWRLDCRLAALAEAAGCTYTRYADDLAFSGDATFARGARAFAVRVAAIAQEEGFLVNHRKTRAKRQGQRQEVAGVVVNAHASVRRAERDALRAILTNCVRHGPASQVRDCTVDFRASLQGRVAWVEHVCPAQGARLRRILERIEWDARRDDCDTAPVPGTTGSAPPG